jgi:ABC-type glycerol-3-phosphate transport system substrate-binding protein
MRMIRRRVGKITLVALALIWLTANTQAAQSDWQKDWEQTLAAAKKEGQVTVYIYRYEGLLQDFKRDYPGINVVAVTGRGNDLTNRIMAERRGGKYIADVYSGGTNSLYNTLYKGKALDPLKPLLILPEVTEQCSVGLQHHAGQSQGVQILRRRGPSQVERQDRLPRSARYRLGCDHAILLLQPGNRP